MTKRIVLGVTGSIAAFKAAFVASQLLSQGFEVRCVLTPGAARFVAPLTFESLTGRPVPIEVWDEAAGTSRMGHLDLAQWSDMLVVAPASAASIARLALGLAPDMLGAVALATTCPLLLAPAMETAMWEHPATQAHIGTLRARGALVVGPASGRLASGKIGLGRMVEPGEIVQAVERAFAPARDLRGARVVVTAGPTQEPIDPVRFLGNRSSGKMGYALAEEAARRGAEVTLIAGPTALADPPGVRVVHVSTHAEMRDAVLEQAPEQEVVVMAAAVADFRPGQSSDVKLKRRDGVNLSLVPTEDIAAEAVRVAPHAIHVGFALETGDVVDGAREKLKRKGQHLVVGNAISDTFSPFGSESNRVTFVTEGGVEEFPELPKAEVAHLLWDRVSMLRAQSESHG